MDLVSATLPAAATLSATGTNALVASASLPSVATQVTTATASLFASASLPGVATLTATGTNALVASASLPGVATLTATAANLAITPALGAAVINSVFGMSAATYVNVKVPGNSGPRQSHVPWSRGRNRVRA